MTFLCGQEGCAMKQSAQAKGTATYHSGHAGRNNKDVAIVAVPFRAVNGDLNKAHILKARFTASKFPLILTQLFGGPPGKSPVERGDARILLEHIGMASRKAQ